jgi:2-polyprenyl-3-methyl-5-hydroxy-6-metoxy-1,4-benzoquinol methylase
MECPIGDNVTHRLFQVDGYWIRECQGCHLHCVEIEPTKDHVKEVYGDSYFIEGGAGYSDYVGEADIITTHGRQYGKILKNFMKPGKVLDVGAAAGFFMKGLKDFGWDGIGLEPNEKMAEFGNRKTGVRISIGALEQFSSSEKFDLITMVQVIPHFYKINQALQAAADLTKPSGYWLIETWNKDSLIARMMGKNWHEYSPPSVLHFFSPETLRMLIGKFGFEEIARGRPAKKIKSGHAKSLLQHKMQVSKMGKLAGGFINLIPDNLTLPYPSYDLFWALYKKTS